MANNTKRFVRRSVPITSQNCMIQARRASLLAEMRATGGFYSLKSPPKVPILTGYYCYTPKTLQGDYHMLEKAGVLELVIVTTKELKRQTHWRAN